MRITRAVVPAAGRGTRLYPITKVQPKEMLPLGTRPVIQSVAEELTAAGVTDILLITAESKRVIEDHFDPASGLTCDEAPAEGRPYAFPETSARVYSIRQGGALGLGHAVACGAQFGGDEHFVVALGDCIMTGPEPLQRLVEAHRRHQADLSIIVQQVGLEGTKRYGIVATGERLDETALQMTDIVEKPGPEAAPSRFAVAARYVFSPALFRYLADATPGLGGEIQLTDAIRAMLADGLKGIAVPLMPGEHRLDVGNIASYARAFIRMMLTDRDQGEALRGYAAKLLAHINDPGISDPDLPSGL